MKRVILGLSASHAGHRELPGNAAIAEFGAAERCMLGLRPFAAIDTGALRMELGFTESDERESANESRAARGGRNREN